MSFQDVKQILSIYSLKHSKVSHQPQNRTQILYSSLVSHKIGLLLTSLTLFPITLPCSLHPRALLLLRHTSLFPMRADAWNNSERSSLFSNLKQYPITLSYHVILITFPSCIMIWYHSYLYIHSCSVSSIRL